MTKTLKLFCFTLLVQILFAPNVYGNSYMAMITTPPADYTQSDHHHVYRPITTPANDLYHRSNVLTQSPVVVDPSEKIAAWEYAQAHPYRYSTFKEDLENIVYAIETIALGGLIYLFMSD